ncbi:hypothetical protein QE422_001856 [Chryseobacterium sp. SORGH_AS 447]|uniref:hypothetical protein n=1 Tax=Chryseobacterium sp. SORGH_AS_0447 TaxID=3041769 RepID=UPI00278242FC|nr:hypothetical protein [Chryseobacterium sp. SORGH_AS_0447]MDQ1161488.1 hypothetical protein [Chryseobacterium sp. SORGH_AS_0447]
MKIVLLFFMVFGKILTAQLLTVNNLRHLTSGSLQNLDTKLAEHFDLERNREMEDPNNRVYATENKTLSHFKVLTVFTNARNCMALSLVTHDRAEVYHFHEDLLKEGFIISDYQDQQGNSGKKYIREDIIVTIKNTGTDIPAHQVVWRCRQ